MPLNESHSRIVRSNLTREQKRQAEAAIYGLPQEITMPTNDLTFEEIEKMRAIVAQHDQVARGPARQFDLNNPPQEPYVYQQFPKVMFHHDKKLMKKANSAEDMDEAIKAGWSKDPFPSEPEEVVVVLDPATAAEVRDLDERLKKAKAPAAVDRQSWEVDKPDKPADKPQTHTAAPPEHTGHNKEQTPPPPSGRKDKEK